VFYVTISPLPLVSGSHMWNSGLLNPLISVVLGNWLSLPTLQIQEEEDEAVNNDGTRVAETSMAEGVNFEVEVHPRIWCEWKTYPAFVTGSSIFR
jgi:hypothetical protein